MRRRILAVRLLLACLMLAPAIARAADASVGDVAAGLASPAYDDVATAVQRLGVLGGSRAAPIVEALRDHDLFALRDAGQVPPPLFIRSGQSYTDALTGQSATPDPATLRPVRMNNRVRSAVASAEGMLQLASPDPGSRSQAAGAIFAAHGASALPALDRAIAGEQDPQVRTRLRQARASCLLAEPTATTEDKLAAIATLKQRGGLDTLAQIGGLAVGEGPVAKAARNATAAINLNLRLWSFAQSIFYGLSLGSVLLLAAMGLAITFGVMGVINMAHGELVMIGAYATYVVQQQVAAHLPALAPVGILIAIPAAFAVSGGLGILIERSLIRFLYGRPLETLLATWGLSLILQQATRSLFGPTNVGVSSPAWMSGAILIGGLTITLNRLAIIAFSGLVMAALMATLRATPLGLSMRAVTQNRRMAASMGIRTPWIDALTFGLGSGVAGLAGVALSQIDNVSPNLGQAYIIDSFMVVVFGGVGNLWGTLVGALSLGVLNKFLEPFAGAVLGKIVVLIAIIAFIQRRPRGLFPVRGRAVET